MTTIMFRRGNKFLVADIILTVLEPLGLTRQVVYFCRDSDGNKYRVPKSEVIVMGRKPQSRPKKKKERKCCA